MNTLKTTLIFLLVLSTLENNGVSQEMALPEKEAQLLLQEIIVRLESSKSATRNEVRKQLHTLSLGQVHLLKSLQTHESAEVRESAIQAEWRLRSRTILTSERISGTLTGTAEEVVSGLSRMAKTTLPPVEKSSSISKTFSFQNEGFWSAALKVFDAFSIYPSLDEKLGLILREQEKPSYFIQGPVVFFFQEPSEYHTRLILLMEQKQKPPIQLAEDIRIMKMGDGNVHSSFIRTSPIPLENTLAGYLVNIKEVYFPPLKIEFVADYRIQSWIDLSMPKRNVMNPYSFVATFE
jgi:hypothetical protein